MMQGRAPTTQSGHKTEPHGKAVNPGGASQIGLAQGEARSIEPMYQGKVGPQAPPSQNHVHHCGTQGKHR